MSEKIFIILDKEISQLVEKAKKEAERREFSYRSPSPLLSEFWRTNFTPSSFEVAVNELKKRNFSINGPIKIFSIQPCVRVSDISYWFDGIHLLYFHMFTFFVINPTEIQNEIEWFLSLLDKLGISIEKTYFSYYSHKHDDLIPKPLFENFGLDLLKSLNISSKKCLPITGFANYQITYNIDPENKNEILTEGPRIELFTCINNKPIEYGTLVYTCSSWLDKEGNCVKKSPPMLAMVFGIERVYQTIKGVDSFEELEEIKEIKNEIINKANLSDFFSKEVVNLINIMIGLIGIAQNSPEDFNPGGKGSNYELKKLVRLSMRIINELGIKKEILFEIFEKRDINITKLRNWFEIEKKLERKRYEE